MQTLLTQLAHADNAVRIVAENALIKVGDPLPLIDLLADASAPNEARWRAAAILGDLADARALDVLIAALTDSSPEVRTWATWSLCLLHHPAAYAALTKIILQGAVDEHVPFMAGLGLLRQDRAAAQPVYAQAEQSANEVTRRVALGVYAYVNHMG